MEFPRHCSFASRIVINLDKKDFSFEELQLANGKVFGLGMREMKLYGVKYGLDHFFGPFFGPYFGLFFFFGPF